jgi:hypothetical protein
MDIMPTILEQVGIPLPDKLDGRSLLPLLQGKPQTGRDHLYTTQITSNRVFRFFPCAPYTRGSLLISLMLGLMASNASKENA